MPVIRRTANRLQQRVARADAATPEQSATAWHEVRKAAKRLRYTGEVAVPAVSGAKAVVTAAKALQTAIGDEQDARLVLDRLLGRPDAPRAAVLLATERAHRAVREAGDAASPALHDLSAAVGDLA